ncbi:MAG: hypothetical protein J7M05_11255 [Anaerolineae bacterium]|nr:hypothetical protein [Anaerolineae bacterium]
MPGGEICPQCGQQVPERETFGGQGGHYLRVLTGISLALFALFVFIATHKEASLLDALECLYSSGWFWVYLLIFLAPIALGLYYWFLLREEEIVVTDEYIARRSYWGDEFLRWADVARFQRQPTLFRRMRLGRVAGLSRLFTKGRLFLNLPPVAYELVSKPDANGNVVRMRLEPGTIADLPWLLELIEERVGPPQEAP